MNWKKPIPIPLWGWTIYWTLSMLGAHSLFVAILSGLLVVLPIWEELK